MPFKNILKRLVDATPQTIGAIVIDWEGEAVQEFCRCDPYEIRFAAAHQGIILSRLKEIHGSGQRGAVEEVTLTTSTCHLVIGCINKEYALAMHIGRNGSLGVALRHFRQAIRELEKEI